MTTHNEANKVLLSTQAVLNQLQVANGASFDSLAQEHDRFCLPDTRVDLLQEIADWSRDVNAEPIFWLNGMAGTGKSTISRTVARLLSEKDQLGASFFFKKGEADRGNLSKFFTTIAADLVIKRPSVTPHIRDILDVDHSITKRNAGEQFDKLLLQPLLRITDKGPPTTMIIDALDECERDEDARLILRLFSRFKTEMPRHVRIFLTSRPELPIRCGFKQIQSTYQHIILHEIPQPIVEHNIAAFLEHELSMIRKDYNDSGIVEYLPSDWPSRQVLDKLIEMTVPLFIAATTLCLFIGDRRIATPSKQLESILSRKADESSQFERIYRPVLDNLLVGLSMRQQEQVLKEFHEVVGCIILLESPLSISALAKLLNMPRSDIDSRLALLHSVLSIPTLAAAPVRLLHLSFRDFLLDSGNPSMPFLIDEKQTHADLMANCLRVLESLKKDVCNIRALGTFSYDISAEKICSCLPVDVEYACLYWVHHLEKADIYVSDGTAAHIFLLQHFLHWLEALSLMGKASESPRLLRILKSRIKVKKSFIIYH